MGPVVTGLGEVYIWTVEFTGPAARTGAPYVTPEGERLVTDAGEGHLSAHGPGLDRRAAAARPCHGVAGVDVLGGYVKEYAVHPDPGRLAAYGVGLVQLVEALEHANRIAGAGYVNRAGEAYIVRADARLKSLDDLAQTPILNRGGQVIRVSDVATVEIGRAPAPRLGQRQRPRDRGRHGPDAAGRELARGRPPRRRTAGGDQAPACRPASSSGPALDRTDLVEATIRTVEHNLALGALLVIAVLFFALGNVRAAIITALVIPLSFLFAASAMNRFGISANLMSLGALDFGLIVDGAVVVIENTLRRLGARSATRPGRALTVGRTPVGVAADARRARWRGPPPSARRSSCWSTRPC